MTAIDKESRKPIRIRYRNANESDSSPSSFLSRLVSKSTDRPIEIVRERSAFVDLQFTSVQLPRLSRVLHHSAKAIPAINKLRGDSKDARWNLENPSPVGPAGAHIWFTGENMRPPSSEEWNGYLSFDVDSLAGKNVYCPLWWTWVGLLGKPFSPFLNNPPSISDLTALRNPEKRREKFAVAFINNPHPMRFQAIKLLKKVGRVDVFGNSVGRPVKDKAEIASEYRFILCFENDLYPGYVTEKPIEGWATGAVPLWWGLDPAGFLNEGALVNAAAQKDMDEFIEKVWVTDKSDDIRAEMTAKNLLNRVPSLEAAQQLIRNSLQL